LGCTGLFDKLSQRIGDIRLHQLLQLHVLLIQRRFQGIVLLLINMRVDNLNLVFMLLNRLLQFAFLVEYGLSINLFFIFLNTFDFDLLAKSFERSLFDIFQILLEL